MSSILIVSASPSAASRSERLAKKIAKRIASREVKATLLDVRDLPTEDLMFGRRSAPGIARVIALVADADGVVIITPIYKAAYSGLLKTFLDALPPSALRGKVVLPIAVGGSAAHVLAIDYALRPVLNSLDSLHVVEGLFLLDKQITVLETEDLLLEPELAQRLDGVLDRFLLGLRRAGSARALTL